ncbi:UGSC family (seleno)protein [Pseudonocardia cypriaca]|nr:UGSC family (seleno)protein [Pseudonocardia cypriaca]
MIDPTAGPSATAAGPPRAGRPERLDGLVVGLVANPKKNAEPFLDAVGELLAAEHGTAGVVRTRKTSITDPIPPATLDELVRRCDVVLIGVGDCGSCSAAAVADGIAFEGAGVPAAVICTDAFRVSADAMARLQGSPGYAYVTTAHPLAPLDADAVRERARLALPELVELLTSAVPVAAR